MQDIEAVTPSGRKLTINYGTRVSELLEHEEFADLPYPAVAAYVNNEIVSLSFKVEVNARIRPVTPETAEGARIYRRSLCYLLSIAQDTVFPDRRLVIGHSLGDGYFYYFHENDGVSEEDLRQLTREMHRLIDKGIPIVRRVLSYSDALELLETTGRTAAMQLLEHRNDPKIPIYECGDFRDISHGPLVSHTSMLGVFELMKHDPGFLLRYPAIGDPYTVRPFTPQPVVFSIFQEYRQWGIILGVGSAGRLNSLARTKGIEEFIRVAEALHDKKIAAIADRISERRASARLVLIAGPSSSGKTTFTKKLAVQLRVVGFNPVIVSTDDYFLPRELTPKDEEGELDFESIEAIDVDFLNRNLISLLELNDVELPRFDFKSGHRREKGRKLRLGERSIVLIEGIHSLNPQLTREIPAERKFQIYVSALTQLNIDDRNRVPTTDVRLIRRMVRDHQFRGYSALDTIRRWPSVRRGESANIFPFEGNAEVAFNSALDYELPVLKAFAEPLLKTIKPYHEEYHEAKRLEQLLENFILIPSKYIPADSILREFVGDSVFKY